MKKYTLVAIVPLLLSILACYSGASVQPIVTLSSDQIALAVIQTQTALSALAIAPTNKPEPTEQIGPNYVQLLEANGFTYNVNDKSYTGSCGLVVSVKPDSLGFGTYVDEGGCSVEELGKILTVLYPPDVFDFIAANLTSAMEGNQPIVGQAAGHKISIYYNHADHILAVAVFDKP